MKEKLHSIIESSNLIDNKNRIEMNTCSTVPVFNCSSVPLFQSPTRLWEKSKWPIISTASAGDLRVRSTLAEEEPLLSSSLMLNSEM